MAIVIKGLGTANPPLYVTQQEAYEFFMENFTLTPEEQDLYKRVLRDSPIRGRYYGLDKKTDARNMEPDSLHARFLKYGRSTAAAAARQALAKAGVTPAAITGLVVNTCTGYLCPGLSSYLVEDLGLSQSVKVFDLMGMGCGAAVPNLECAAGMLERNTGGPVLSVAVEICSATMFPSHEPALAISYAIFGDGAAAAVLEDADPKPGLPRIRDFATGIIPGYREDLRYRHERGLLRNHLSKRVPVIGARTVAEVADRLLARHGLARSDITWWAVHPGGTSVLTQVGKELGIGDHPLRFSYGIFEQYGNMSSPSVLFVLDAIMEQGHPSPGQKGLLLSFGAGFTAFAALLEF